MRAPSDSSTRSSVRRPRAKRSLLAGSDDYCYDESLKKIQLVDSRAARSADLSRIEALKLVNAATSTSGKVACPNLFLGCASNTVVEALNVSSRPVPSSFSIFSSVPIVQCIGHSRLRPTKAKVQQSKWGSAKLTDASISKLLA